MMGQARKVVLGQEPEYQSVDIGPRGTKNIHEFPFDRG
jgi:hypothetical protein